MADDPRRDLDALAAKAARQLRGWAWRRALERAAPALFPAALAVPVATLLVAIAHALGAPFRWPLEALPSIALALALPPLAVAAHALWTLARRDIERERSLALYDHQLRLCDRLQTADEFLRRGASGGFAQAAVEDAAAYAAKALAAPPPAVTPAAPKWSAARWPLGVLATVVMAAALFLDGQAFALARDAAKPQTEAAPAVANASEPAQPEEPAPRDAEQRRPASEPPATANRGAAVGVFPDARRPQRAQAAPAGARSPSDEAEADAHAGNDSQATAATSGPTGTGAAKRPDTPNTAPRKPQRPRKPKPAIERDREGATSGVATGKGNSAGSQIASSDHPPAENRTRADDADNDVEDLAEEEEDEEQKAASSHRPALNNRKAPVDRSLSPGANSNQERDDLNGRGGPGGLKKTRGVAAMLLGVPAPDHLRGKANPGRMKVRRERAEPEEKNAGLADAAGRGERQHPIGTIAHPHLQPWMQDLVRDYFLARNAGLPSDPSDPSSPSGPPNPPTENQQP